MCVYVCVCICVCVYIPALLFIYSAFPPATTDEFSQLPTKTKPATALIPFQPLKSFSPASIFFPLLHHQIFLLS